MTEIEIKIIRDYIDVCRDRVKKSPMHTASRGKREAQLSAVIDMAISLGIPVTLT